MSQSIHGTDSRPQRHFQRLDHRAYQCQWRRHRACLHREPLGGHLHDQGFRQRRTEPGRLQPDQPFPAGDQPERYLCRKCLCPVAEPRRRSRCTSWVNALNVGTAPAAVVQEIEQSPEYLNDVVRALYQHYLNRAPDSGGLTALTGQLAGGVSIESVTAEILSSPEYFNDKGGNNTAFVQGLYQDVLGRTGSPTDVQGWVNALNSGATRDQVALRLPDFGRNIAPT